MELNNNIQNMEYSFKKFEGRNLKTEDRITITKSESVGFPQRFFQDNQIDQFKYATIYWDRDNLALAIKFTNDESEKSKFKIIKSKAGYGGSIIVRSFFKVNSIDPILYHGRYSWEKKTIDDIGEVYIIKLAKREAELLNKE